MPKPAQPPPLKGVLETVLYYHDEDATRSFYEDLLGCRPIGKEPNRYLFYRAGSSVLLLFIAEKSKASTRLPPHGTKGEGHVCFQVNAEDYERWKTHIAATLEIEKEVEWPKGRSFYFRDPSKNCLEIANNDFWPA